MGGGGEEEDIPKEQPMGVSARPDCGFRQRQPPRHRFARGLFRLFSPFITGEMLRHTSA